MTAQEASGHTISELGVRAWGVWRDAFEGFREVVVAPAIPILYFGDLGAYLASSLRVVTVGLNPSREEFPLDDRFRRFPGARGYPELAGNGYTEVLNDYFRADPYRAWFSTFEHLLVGMDASYYGGRPNTALHTDLCSPVATDPTWSRLGDGARQGLMVSGRPLWHDLIRVLRPDVMLISVARRHLARIEFDTVEPPWELHRLESSRSRPYVVKAWRVRLDESSDCLVVFGQAAQRPFGTVSRFDKQGIGRRIRDVAAGG